ncbi:MAG TPA: carbohydrate kinase family protein [Chryseosolibacter sp.]|jgi:sugar/nucleoside kinase (ribokinase family)|nr:carbohydrate kinase family protein [Chryseosolibacter sp.]
MTPTKKSYDVVVAGELNVDVILNDISRFPAMGKEVIAGAMSITLGSSSAIFASNLSVLGTRVAFSGMLARDQFGALITSSLQSRRVDTRYIVYTDRCSTGATIALNFGEDRAMVTYPGNMTLFSLQDIPDELLQASGHLHVSSIFLSTGLKKDVNALFRKAKSLGLTTSLDPQWDPDERWDIDFRTLLPDVDVFLPNENELLALTAKADIGEAVDALGQYANIIVVKRGREGASLWKSGEWIHQPAFVNDQVQDAIGAGDSFCAGFIHEFIKGKKLSECLAFGALTGAINTTRAGGTTAFDSMDTVRSIARSSFNFNL